MWLYRCHLEFSSLVTSRKVQINKFLLNTREQYSIDVQIIDTCNTELVFYYSHTDGVRHKAVSGCGNVFTHLNRK